MMLDECLWRAKHMKPQMLFVSPEFPCPPLSGGQLRTVSLLHCLAPHFEIHCVTFAEVQPRPKSAEMLRSYVAKLTVLPLEPHYRTSLRRYARNIGRAVRFVPPLVDRFREPEHRRALAGLLNNKTDWVWLEHLWLAPYVARIRHPASTILDVHNVESDFYRQLRHASRHLFDRLGYYVFEQAARRIERQYLSSFDRVVAVSDGDRRLLEQNCSADKIFLLPNAVKLGPLPVAEDPPGYSLYFAGRLDYSPNRDAVLWFHRWVWPRIQSQLPEVRWYIVGACPEVLGTELRRDTHILLAGPVEETGPYLHPSSLVIVPLGIGGGTRFKILEAWAAGKAVVSTAKGAEGLAVRHGENIWISDTPEEFGDAVLHLLMNPKLRAHLGRRGWATLHEHYSWERLQDRLEAMLFRG